MIERIQTLVIMSAAALLAVACAPDGGAAQTASADAAPASAGAPSNVGAEPAAGPVLPQAGQRYWAARRELLAQGYEPVVAPDAEPFSVCVAEMEAGAFLAGDCPGETVVLPEVEGCAGTGMGNCRTSWRHPGTERNLIVFTTGEPQPGVVSDTAWVEASVEPAVSTERACRQAVQVQFGQSGPAVTFIDGVVSWRAPVDGGRLSFTCTVNGDAVSLARESETLVVTLNAPADRSAQQEAH